MRPVLKRSSSAGTKIYFEEASDHDRRANKSFSTRNSTIPPTAEIQLKNPAVLSTHSRRSSSIPLRVTTKSYLDEKVNTSKPNHSLSLGWFSILLCPLVVAEAYDYWHRSRACNLDSEGAELRASLGFDVSRADFATPPPCVTNDRLGSAATIHEADRGSGDRASHTFLRVRMYRH